MRWIPWYGGDCPVAPDTIVEPRYRGPSNPALGIRIEWPVRAARLDWTHEDPAILDDIIAYRVVEPAACLS